MINKKNRIFLIIIMFFLFISSLALAQEQNRESLMYKNVAMGIEITGPKGWFMHEMPGERWITVDFTLVPFGSKSNSEDFPIISLSTGPAKDVTGRIIDSKTPLEKANQTVENLKDMSGMMDIKETKIIEEPNLVKINNLEGARFMYEVNIENTLRTSEYIFMKGDLFYSLKYTNKPEYFDKHLKEFEESVKTFELK